MNSTSHLPIKQLVKHLCQAKGDEAVCKGACGFVYLKTLLMIHG